MPEIFFENAATKKRYKVVRFNKEAGTVTLVGPHNMEFDEKFDKDRFVKMGYSLVQGEAAAPPPPGAAPPPPAEMVVAG